MRRTLTVTALAAAACSAHAADLFVLNFEAAGGYTTSIAEFTDGGSDYFFRTNGSGMAASNVYNGATGSFFAAHDIDGEGATLPVSLTTSTFSIANHNNLRFAVDLAEDDDGANQDWDLPDYVNFEYSLDGGSWQSIFSAINDGSTFNSAAFINGVEITSTFSTFSADLSALTGSTLAVRIVFSLDAGDEDIAIDNIRVTGDAINIVPLPPAAWAGMGLLATIAGVRAARRR